MIAFRPHYGFLSEWQKADVRSTTRPNRNSECDTCHMARSIIKGRENEIYLCATGVEIGSRLHPLDAVSLMEPVEHVINVLPKLFI